MTWSRALRMMPSVQPRVLPTLRARPPRLLWRGKKRGFNPCVSKIPWREVWQPTPVFLPEESQAQRSLAGYSLQGHKESDTTEQLSTHARTVILSYSEPTSSRQLQLLSSLLAIKYHFISSQ